MDSDRELLMALDFWIKNGKVVVDGSGHPILCATCPCGTSPTCMTVTKSNVAFSSLTVTLPAGFTIASRATGTGFTATTCTPNVTTCTVTTAAFSDANALGGGPGGGTDAGYLGSCCFGGYILWLILSWDYLNCNWRTMFELDYIIGGFANTPGFTGAFNLTVGNQDLTSQSTTPADARGSATINTDAYDATNVGKILVIA